MGDDLNALERKIQEAKANNSLAADAKPQNSSNNNAGLQAGMEFVAAIVISSALGYAIDSYFKTLPFFLILLFVLGSGAGFMSLYRASKNMGFSAGYSQLHRPKKTAKQSPESTPLGEHAHGPENKHKP
jgi:F0F1-type ATP synthase assembly protein I